MILSALLMKIKNINLMKNSLCNKLNFLILVPEALNQSTDCIVLLVILKIQMLFQELFRENTIVNSHWHWHMAP